MLKRNMFAMVTQRRLGSRLSTNKVCRPFKSAVGPQPTCRCGALMAASGGEADMVSADAADFMRTRLGACGRAHKSGPAGRRAGLHPPCQVAGPGIAAEPTHGDQRTDAVIWTEDRRGAVTRSCRPRSGPADVEGIRVVGSKHLTLFEHASLADDVSFPRQSGRRIPGSRGQLLTLGGPPGLMWLRGML